MRVGVQTLPLHTNIGGILQAYALQSTLRGMGHEVYIISRSRRERLHPIIAPMVWGIRFFLRHIVGNKDFIIFLEQQYPIISQHTERFIDSYINRLPCSKYTALCEHSFDAIVVGSDQVWRPQYFGKGMIKEAYLAFARTWDIKRIAYAASFGTDEWEYTKRQSDVCRELISLFDAVSVREDSAVELCKEHFGVVAEHLLDPTMLLDRGEYIDLVRRASTPKSSGNLLLYILDESPDKESVIEAIVRSRGLRPFRVNSRVEDRSAPLNERIQPPIEEWLRGFMDAEFVVADSYHAVLFSIIFNKPFIAYGNRARGASRFSSLLKIFGLERQLIYSSSELDLEHCAEIDWDKVNSIHAEKRSDSIEFIAESLGAGDQRARANA